MKVFDATGTVMGRLSSSVARALMDNEEVVIVNAEKAVITGSKQVLLDKYGHRRERKSIVNPRRHGPFYPRRPDRIIKRAVRGMVPYKKEKGRKALKRLRVYVGTPEELKEEEKIVLEDSTYRKLTTPKYMELGELSRLLGSEF